MIFAALRIGIIPSNVFFEIFSKQNENATKFKGDLAAYLVVIQDVCWVALQSPQRVVELRLKVRQLAADQRPTRTLRAANDLTRKSGNSP